MRLPTRVCYALLAMMDLALGGDRRPVSREEIAARHGLSQPYLSQVLLHLTKAGLIRSTKGRGGGYSLADAASAISLQAVLAAIGEPPAPPDCIDHPDACLKSGDCPARDLWRDLAVSFRQALEQISLADAAMRCLPDGGGHGDEAQALMLSLRASGNGVIVTDTEGRVRLLNRAAEELTGWAEAQAIGRPVTELLRFADDGPLEPEAFVAKVLHLGEDVRAEGWHSLVKRDGLEQALACGGSAWRNGDGGIRGAIFVLQDATGERQQEEEMLRANWLESLGLLAASVAHEFNDLLTAILGNVSLARMEAGQAAPGGEALAEVEAASLQAKGLAWRLLAAAARRAPSRKAIALGDVLGEVGAFALRGSACRLDLQVTDDLRSVVADETQVHQALLNLIRNACEAMPLGGVVTVRAENVELTPENGLPLPPGTYVAVAIADEGVGIPERLHPRLFEPHFTTKPDRSGLGLATTRSILRRHGGHIAFESRVEVGTTFRVYLPAGEEPAPSRVAAPEPAEPTPRRVLVMDDGELVRRVVRRMLERQGYLVETATDGAEALAAYRQALEEGRPFSAAILDSRAAGGMGGAEVLARLMELAPEVKALAMTDYPDEEHAQALRRVGFGEVVVKPLHPEDLTQALARCLALRPQAKTQRGEAAKGEMER